MEDLNRAVGYLNLSQHYINKELLRLFQGRVATISLCWFILFLFKSSREKPKSWSWKICDPKTMPVTHVRCLSEMCVVFLISQSPLSLPTPQVSRRSPIAIVIRRLFSARCEEICPLLLPPILEYFKVWCFSFTFQIYNLHTLVNISGGGGWLKQTIPSISMAEILLHGVTFGSKWPLN